MKKILNKILIVMMSFILLFSAVGCGGEPVADENVTDNDEFYTINWYMPVTTATKPSDLGVVQKAVNNYLKDKINAAVNIKAYNFMEYGGKVNTKLANAEPMDLIWTDFESYPRYLDMETLYPLDKLFENYAPDAYNKFPEEFYNQIRSPKTGKIYAVINNQILPRTFGIEVRDNNYYFEYILSVANKLLEGVEGVDKSDHDAVQDYIADNFTMEQKLDVIENYLLWLKANKSGDNQSAGGIMWGMELLYVMEALGYDSLGMSMAVPGVIHADTTGELKVINQFETDDFKSLVNRLKSWYEKGIIPADIQSGHYDQRSTDLGSSRTWTPDWITEFKQGGVQRQSEVIRFGKPHYIESYVSGTMWALPETCGNPARVMKFLNLLHTDSKLHNMLKLGIEGEHYTVDDNGQAVLTKKSQRYCLEKARWIFGDETIGMTLNTQSKDLYTKIKKVNSDTPLSAVMGFAFDREPVMTQIQLSTSIVTKYISNLGCGEEYYKDEEYYNKFIDELKANKCDEVIAEKQRQLDNWLASKA